MIKWKEVEQQKHMIGVLPQTKIFMYDTQQKLKRKIRWVIAIFVFFLVLSGVTAFPVETELRWVLPYLAWLPSPLYAYLQEVYTAVSITNSIYPFIAYGFDWLAFAHIVIGLAFIGPFRDPVRNIWVIEWAMLCCLAIIPLAFICGPIRSIPLYWTLVDCSFGVIGILPLWYCHKLIRKLERTELNRANGQ